jgi:hypothetical protein
MSSGRDVGGAWCNCLCTAVVVSAKGGEELPPGMTEELFGTVSGLPGARWNPEIELHVVNGPHRDKSKFFMDVHARLLAVMETGETGKMTRIAKDFWERAGLGQLGRDQKID